jgi:ribosomal protein S18 acetylase RimI-like enzyme
LFTVDKVSESGKGFAEAMGAEYRFSEYSLKLKEEKAYKVAHEDLRMRPATEEDFGFMAQCTSSAFGDPLEMARELLQKTNKPNRKSYVVELAGQPVGMMRVLEFGAKGAALHGFSILPEYQGRGFGRQILSETVKMLKETDRPDMELDVEVENTNALHLYQSCGFEVTSGYDFYEVTPQKCDITAPVRHQLTAYNNRDIDAFIACYAEDCVIEDGVGNVTMRGTAAMHESYARMFESSPELHCHLASRTIVGNYILDEERVTGRAGRDGQSHVVAVYRVENGLIQHVRFLR